MVLFILESIGTWELMLVGLVALIIFGPRKIPELARKAGKMVFELRQVSNEFRSTWEKEVTLDDDEKKAFDFRDESLSQNSIAAPKPAEEPTVENKTSAVAPEIRELDDPEKLDKIKSSIAPPPAEDTNEKQNWL